MIELSKEKKKYSFKEDYCETAHESCLISLSENSRTQNGTYGLDRVTKQAVKLIRKKIKNPKSDIYLVSTGTQANLTIISHSLKSYESVIASSTGHISLYEAGAIESTGHKINTIKTKDGKLNSEDIKSVLKKHSGEHMVKPKLVYITNSTELGTVYKKNELEKLSIFCKKNDLFLFLDGARLGTALTSKNNDLSFEDLPKLVDVFYIGGGKNGALFGEAIVIVNNELKKGFRNHLKQKGALFAKSSILGTQFVELFRNDLFFKLARHANEMALLLSNSIKNLGYDFLVSPESNMIFPIFPNKLIKELEKLYAFYLWDENSDNKTSVVRLVTSWATEEKFVKNFITDLNFLAKKV